MTKKKRHALEIVVCVVHQNTVSYKWAEWFRFIQIPTPNNIISTNYPLFDCSREIVTRSALQQNPKWVFFLDSDILLPLDGIPRLIEIAEEQKIDVLSGLYWLKALGVKHGTQKLEEEHVPCPNGFVWGKLNKERNDFEGYSSIQDELAKHLGKKSIAEVNGVGAGCLLVKADVFRRLDESNPKKPFFQWGTYRKDDRTGKPLLQVGEDLYFCHRLFSELGIKPFLSTEVVCDHVFYPAVTMRRGKDGKLVLC